MLSNILDIILCILYVMVNGFVWNKLNAENRHGLYFGEIWGGVELLCLW